MNWPQWTWYEWTVNTITVFGIVSAVLFIVDYWRMSQGMWVHNEYGRFFMAYPAVMFFLLSFVLGARNVDSVLVRQLVGVTLYSGLVLTLPWLHRLMRLSMRRNSSRSMPVRDEG